MTFYLSDRDRPCGCQSELKYTIDLQARAFTTTCQKCGVSVGQRLDEISLTWIHLPHMKGVDVTPYLAGKGHLE